MSVRFRIGGKNDRFYLWNIHYQQIQWCDFGKNWVWQKQPEASNMFFYSICIRGSFSNLCVHTGISQSPYSYRDCWNCNPRMHMGNSSLYAYGEDLGNPRMHMPGTGQSLTICIWNPFPYGKSKLGSQSANFTIRGLPYAYAELCMHTSRDHKKILYGDPHMHMVVVPIWGLTG